MEWTATTSLVTRAAVLRLPQRSHPRLKIPPTRNSLCQLSPNRPKASPLTCSTTHHYRNLPPPPLHSTTNSIPKPRKNRAPRQCPSTELDVQGVTTLRVIPLRSTQAATLGLLAFAPAVTKIRSQDTFPLVPLITGDAPISRLRNLARAHHFVSRLLPYHQTPQFPGEIKFPPFTLTRNTIPACLLAMELQPIRASATIHLRIPVNQSVCPPQESPPTPLPSPYPRPSNSLTRLPTLTPTSQNNLTSLRTILTSSLLAPILQPFRVPPSNLHNLLLSRLSPSPKNSAKTPLLRTQQPFTSLLLLPLSPTPNRPLTRPRASSAQNTLQPCACILLASELRTLSYGSLEEESFSPAQKPKSADLPQWPLDPSLNPSKPSLTCHVTFSRMKRSQ